MKRDILVLRVYIKIKNLGYISFSKKNYRSFSIFFIYVFQFFIYANIFFAYIIIYAIAYIKSFYI